MMLTYWRSALQRLFCDVKQIACLKLNDVSRLFQVDGFKVASLGGILHALTDEKMFMLLENLDIDVEKKLESVRSDGGKGKTSGGGLVDKVYTFFFHRLPPSDIDQPSLKPDSFVVSIKELNKKVLRYVEGDCYLLRSKGFRDKLFLSKQEMMEFFDREGEATYDAYLIVHALIERGLLFHSRSKDEYKRTIKGYIMHDPESKDYKLYSAMEQIEKNVRFLEDKAETLRKKAVELHDKIVECFKIRSKEVARTFGQQKIKLEKQIVFVLNKKTILEDSLENMKDALHNNLSEDVWKITKDLSERKLLELSDLEDTVQNAQEVKEREEAVYGMMDDKEEDKEIEQELQKIEAEMKLKDLMSPNKGNRMEPEQQPSLFANPFPTTQKKAEGASNPLLGNLSSTQAKEFSFFDQPRKLDTVSGRSKGKDDTLNFH